MSNRALRICGLILVIAGLVLSIRLSLASDEFPEYDSIRANVEFWTQVFAEWSLGQVAVHDLEYPAIVYEVVDLPGPVDERYTEEQSEFVEELNELWSDRLRQMEQKVNDAETLDDAEKSWLLLISTKAGTEKFKKAHERIRTQRGLRERFRRGLEIAGRYEGTIREIFLDVGLPEDLAYLPHVESSYQAAARSSAGAVGVWQFTRGTGKIYLKIDRSIDERLDPIAATRGAAGYLADAFDRFDNWPLALTSYNHGMVGIARAVTKLGNDYERIFNEYDGRSFGFASRNFYSEFLAARTIARSPQVYFPEGLQPEAPLNLDSIALSHRARPSGIAHAYGVPLHELAAINQAWTSRAVRSDHSLPAGVTVWLPAGTLARSGGEVPLPEDGIYVVRRGDTLSGIAAAHGMGVGELRELNGIPASGSLIRPGQQLRVNAEPTQSVHVVRSGETLSSIAARYGMKMGTLRRLNGMKRGDDLIRVGQRLLVHGDEAAGTYVVCHGDTLLEIAVRHGVRLSALLDFNRLSEASVIRPGQLIRIPGSG